MCCGNSVVAGQQQPRPTDTWEVLDADGTVVDRKTSVIAARLAAARIDGTVRSSGEK